LLQPLIYEQLFLAGLAPLNDRQMRSRQAQGGVISDRVVPLAYCGPRPGVEIQISLLGSIETYEGAGALAAPLDDTAGQAIENLQGNYQALA
jgi:hypothetical protein